MIHNRNVIRRFEERGDTAVADLCQEFSRLQRLGDGRQHRIDPSKPYQPGMPPYVPEPDPPTGCGLR